MKLRNLFFMMLAMASSTYGVAATKYGMSGCGLGSLIFQDQKGLVQIFAATTNDTYSNQTFGMSSGTSGCQQSNRETAAIYININQNSLLHDIAKGEGETLVGLSQLYGCSDSKLLGSQLKSSLPLIIPASQVSAQDLGQKIEQVVKDNEVLKNQCKIFS